MFDKEQSDAFVLGPEGMKERCVPVLVLRSLLDWYKQLHHLSVPSGGGPHECRDSLFICWILVRNDDLGGLCVPIPESMV